MGKIYHKWQEAENNKEEASHELIIFKISPRNSHEYI